jgi:hypothetical protein
MANRMTSKAAQQLTQAVEATQRYMDEEDLDPTEAVIKAARDLSLPREMIRLTAQAHNIAQQTAQHKSAATILDRLEEHPLADGQAAIDAVYGSKQAAVREQFHATAVSDVYSRPPEKRASAPTVLASIPALPGRELSQPVPSAGMLTGVGIRQAIKQSRALQKEAEVATEHTYAMLNGMLAAMEKLAQYFKRAEDPEQAFLAADHFATRVLGEKAARVMDCVATKLSDGRRQTKRASTTWDGGLVEAHPDAAPFNLIGDVIKAAEAWLESGIRRDELQDTLVDKVATLMAPYDRVLHAEPNILANHDALRTKASSNMITGMLGGAAASQLADNLAGTRVGKSVNDLTADARGDFESAGHANNLRKIDAEVLLNDMLNNDETLAAYPREEVLNAYNQISELGPRLATHSLTMRPLMHKMMSQGGRLDPHDVEQLIGLDSQLGRRDMPKAAELWDEPRSVLA